MSIENLKDLYLHTLKDIYFAENQIQKALPKMASKAKSAELKKLFEAHLDETKGQITHLKEVFKILGEKAEGEECPAIEGIIEETEELIGEIKDADTRDAGMIAAAQAVEHYEIARYGTLLAWGELLGLDEAGTHLRAILEEEKAANAKLTNLGENKLNKKAA
ncbi:ferritin-like domain-containing protein [Afifella sp. IM 167]|uniref:YciE/YciF ferroxidase family protein n=1 Tax=Afifella sp. IM 167 TaxID=2033586 RepID=UPI001CD0088B|nr:DUF892 family protein [Afifella sp. IM 167]MBZ8131755.1 hypothetical protein [Afifella sp. IM 167]